MLAVALRGSILQIRRYQRLEQDEDAGLSADLVVRGSQERFGPLVTATLATALALTPLLVVGVTAGLEILQPLVAIILGGLVTTTLLNLFVLPTLYLRFAPGRRPDAAGPPRTQQAPA